MQIRIWIKKVGNKFCLMQTDGKAKRKIEESDNRSVLEQRKKFILHDGAFEGPLPTFMTKSV